MRTSLPSWKSALGIVAVTGAALLATAPPALAQDGGGGPDPTAAPVQERVSAEVLPGVVYLQTDVHTYLRNMADGSVEGPFDLSLQCTGFVVNPNGYVATAGHCVSDLDIQEELATEISSGAAQAGYDATTTYNYVMANYKLEGDVGGSPADKKVTVAQASEGPSQTPLQAQIVDSKPNSQGDVALLKVNATNMPTVEVAPANTTTTGTQIMSIGYPGVVDQVMDASLQPTFKDGSVSGTQNQNGIPFLQITADMGQGMSGGPTVNQQGQVVGINSMGISDRSNSFNYVAPSSTLLEMLARNGVQAQPGAFDEAYRAGLADYYQGYYSDAEEQFAKVLDIAPDSQAAADYKAKAARAHDQFGDKGMGLLGWGLIGGGVLFLLVVGGLVVGIVVRNKRRATPQVNLAQPGLGLPTGYQMPIQQTPATVQQYGQAPVPAQYAVPQQYPAPQHQAPQHQAPAGFGAAPFGQGGTMPAAPASPPVGFPAPVAPAPTTPRHEAPEAAAPVAVATPPAGMAPLTDAPTGPGHCPNCGAARATGARFCGGCGVGLA
ncbi:trypsin-like peptidase domain-containing protein [Actinomycetospora termitidis]|uniref:Trypsin-like peptidase domain-containing protein n=1 Tax=Actinomycetospora termitidis TaxID=3053470 RepID=A0ABT7M8M4_9PSEU|nr:trypsin-like peptidase domain-containing protein [Actinomycetospora sp. Odt1-22]MDL5156806.1 trypsin-like peptidase domain-containing protein [Actinomycetospora sp. Odt1-22]